MPSYMLIPHDQVEKANQERHLIQDIDMPLVYQSHDLDVIVEYYAIEDLSDQLRKWTFELVKSNLHDMYVQSNDGWNDQQKRDEMLAPTARYLIARQRQDPNKLWGFIHFQMTHEETMEDDIYAQVAYCYELQIVPEARGKGLGEFLMGVLQRIGKHWGMDKVMLTVFKANSGAFRFYTNKLGFELDPISPGVCLPRRKARLFDYELLSKPCS